ncbi:MAG: DUF1570 domain-containing protein [Planctomycetes bacterium]|nr:DUF1570 domain-containing protein [Planctomycetota bacterium]
MAMSIVRCPFCDRRYNVTGIPSGTKVLCTSCRSTLTVPALRRAARPVLWRRWLPHSSSAQLTVGLFGGLTIATVAYLMLRAPSTPSPDGQGKLWFLEKRPSDAALWPIDHRLSPEEQLDRFTQSIYQEFPDNRFYVYKWTDSPFILALESSDRVSPGPIEAEFHRALSNLMRRFGEEFGAVLGPEEFREILPIVVFTSKVKFDEYLRKGNNAPLPPEVPGMYEYFKRRVVFLHARDGYPIEVLLHEATHQVMHYCFLRRRTDPDRRQSWWFQEGMATYFEQFRRNSVGLVEVDPALTNSRRLDELKKAIQQADPDLPPLYMLMNMDVEDVWKQLGRKMRFTQLSYGQAWALVHFLRHGEGGKYRRLFDDYLRHELEGQGGKDTFSRLLRDRFQMELQELEREIERYLVSLR